MKLDDLLSERAEQFANRRYIKFEERNYSYSEIDNLVSICAGGLNELGLDKGGRVAVLMNNCPEYIVSYFAVLRAGGVAVPVNTFLAPDEISYIINDSGSRILIYGDDFSSSIENIKDSVPGIKAVKYEEIPKGAVAKAKGSENDLAVLLYTSGTTGFPKGAMLTHGNLISNTEASVSAFHVSKKDRFLLFLPLFHSFSFTACVLVPLYSGASIVLLKSVKPFSNVVRSVIRDRITLFAGVPTIYNILARKKIPFYIKLALKVILNIRACISGAAALPEETLRSFEDKFKVPLVEGYGLTEASPVVAVNPLDGVRKPGSVGLPIPGVEVSAINKSGETVKSGDVGELIVRGPNIMRGYYNKIDETAFTLVNGWLYTGDLGKIDDDGYVYIVDRKKDLIIIDGMNIYPREVEECVMKIDPVEECAMVGIPDGKGSEVSILFVKCKEGIEISDSDIRKHLVMKIARFKVPKRIVFLQDLPKTATGKIKKSELRKWDL